MTNTAAKLKWQRSPVSNSLQTNNSLFSGIGELVFPSSVVTFLHSDVAPEFFNCLHVDRVESLNVLVVDVFDQLGSVDHLAAAAATFASATAATSAATASAAAATPVLELDVESVHSAEDGVHRHEDILID